MTFACGSIRISGVTIYYDASRHVVCVPYSIENLHRMAVLLGIKRCWYHAKPYPHYDMPKTYTPPTNIIQVSSRQIVQICKENAMNWCPNCKMNVQPILKSHPTLQLATQTCPRCDSTNLKPARNIPVR